MNSNFNRLSIVLCFWFLSLFGLDIRPTIFTAAEVTATKGESMTISDLENARKYHPEYQSLAGGYSASKLDDEGVVTAAQFCVETLYQQQQMQQDTAQDPGPGSYSFKLTSSVEHKILRASQQVVAGMNYKLTILVQEAGSVSSSCLGAFSATVYDQFGNLSVTNWGPEYTCKDAKSMLDTRE